MESHPLRMRLGTERRPDVGSREQRSRRMPALPTAGIFAVKPNAREAFLLPTSECWRSNRFSTEWRRRAGALPLVLPFFEHVLDRGFIDHQISIAVVAVHLDAIPVIPFDDAAPFFTVAQHDHHRSPRLHLLLIIEVLRIGLLRRRRLLALSPATHWPITH